MTTSRVEYYHKWTEVVHHAQLLMTLGLVCGASSYYVSFVQYSFSVPLLLSLTL